MDVSKLYDLFLEHPRVTTDSRRVPPGGLFFALKGDRFNGNQYAAGALEQGAAYAIVDDQAVVTGERYLLVDDVLQTLQALALHHRRQFDVPVLAITGSNGKTTTKELIAAVLGARYRVHVTSGNLNNHIGVPLTLLDMPADTEVAVIEMGANHQGEIDALCRIAEPTHGLVTNVGNAHLEGFGGFEGVIKGKGELYRYLAETGGTAFVNLDEPHLADMAAPVSRIITYQESTTPDPLYAPMELVKLAVHPNVRVAFLDERGERIECDSNLPGQHNFQNVLTAVSVGRYFKVPGLLICNAVGGYVPRNNRSQRVEHEGIHFILDAYNANPSSMEASLRNFDQIAPHPRAVIMGDMLELGESAPAEHLRLARLAQAQGYEEIVLVGPQFLPAARELGLRHLTGIEALREWFWQRDWTGYTILVKASRGIQLDRLLELKQTA